MDVYKLISVPSPFFPKSEKDTISNQTIPLTPIFLREPIQLSISPYFRRA
jgi:hypothetical protein